MPRQHQPGLDTSAAPQVATPGQRRPARRRLDAAVAFAVDRLESRTMLSVTATLKQGALDVALSAQADAVTLTGQAGQIIVAGGATDQSFAASAVTSITVHEDAIELPLPGLGSSSAQFAGTIAVPGTIQATGLDAITVAAGATLSTRGIAAGADPRSSPSVAPSGDLSLAAEQITVAAGAAVLAQGNAKNRGGEVTLAAEDRATLPFTPGLPFRDVQTDAGVDIADTATVRGRDVLITALASTNKVIDNLQETPADTRVVLLGDVNADGRTDLLVANAGQPVRLFLNNGSTDDPYAVTPLLVGTADHVPTALALGDVNADSKPDLAVGYDDAAVQVFPNNGSPTAFQSVAGVPVGPTDSPTTAVALADLDGDGRADLVVGGTDVPVRRYASTTAGFGDAIALPGGRQTTTSLAAADLDGDGKADLVVGNDGLANSELAQTTASVYYLSPASANATPVPIGVDRPDIRAVALADLNGDGKPDLVVANFGTVSQVFLNAGPAAPFGTAADRARSTSIQAEVNATSVAVADFDNDGTPDVALGVAGGPTRVAFNTAGRGVFTAAPIALDTSTSDTTSVAAADVNGDGHADLVVGTAGDGDFVYANAGVTPAAGASPFATPTEITALDPQLTYASSLPSLVVGPIDLTGLAAFGGAVIAKATSHVTVGAATITADNRVSLLADSVANAELTTLGLALGLGFGSATATSDVVVGNGARITAGGDFTMAATNNNTLFVSLVSPTLIPQQTMGGGNVTIAVGLANTHANADLQPGAIVDAGSAAVLATNTNSFTVSTLNLTFQSGGAGAAAASLVIADKQSDAGAHVGGTVRTAGDVTVDATSTSVKDVASSGATNVNKLQDIGLFRKVVGKLAGGLEPVASLVTKVADAGSSGKGQTIGKTLNLSHGAPQFGVAAAVGIDLTANAADAGLGATADVRAGGSVTVDADAAMTFQAAASAGGGDAQQAALGGSVLVAVPSNTATAHVDANAQVDAAAALTVHADARMPNAVTFLNFRAYIPDPHDPESSDPSNIIANYNLANLPTLIPTDIVTGVLLGLATGAPISGQLANTFTSAGGSGKGKGSVGLAASINVVYQSNAATATIGDDARINQRFTAALPTAQDVSVTANAQLETIDPNGPITALGILGKGVSSITDTDEGVGFGGTLFVGRFGNAAVATVGDGAKISAGRDVTVAATSFGFAVAAAVAGSQSSQAGFQAAESAVLFDSTTTATLSNRAVVVANRDLTVDADGLLEVVNFTGGLVASANLGAGVSAAFTLVTDTTTATIGNGDPAHGPAGSVTVGRDLSVKANGVRDVITVGVSAASSVGGSAAAPSTPTDSTGPTDGISTFDKALNALKGAAGKVTSTDGFGVEVNAAVAFNIVFTDTEATVSGLARATVGGNVTVAASGDAVLVGAGGGAVLAKNAGLSGEFVHNGLFTTTHATLASGPTVADGALAVTADSSAVVAGAAAGSSVATKAFAGNGSAIVTPVLVDTAAVIGNGTSVTGGSIAVAADNDLRVLPIAGAAAVAAGVGGRSVASVGGALAVTVLDETVSATVGDAATLVVAAASTGNVTVTATSSEDVVSLAGSFAASPGGVAAANGSAVPLVIVQDVNASVGQHATVTTSGSVYVGAADTLNRLLIAGGAAGAETAGVGASAVADIATRSVTATVGDNATVDALGRGAAIPDDGSGRGHGVAVNAAAVDRTLHVAVDGAVVAGGDVGAGAAGSLVLGTNIATVVAAIGAGARVNAANPAAADAAQSVRVSADHRTFELGVAGGLAVVAAQNGGGLGAAAATDTIDKTVTATIGADAVVRAADSVLVTAASADRLVGFTVGLAGAGTAAVAGSVQVYVLPTHVSALIDDRADVRAAGNVLVAADNVAQIAVVAGQAAVTANAEEDAVAASFGASIATTTLTATTEARIGRSAVVQGLGQGAAVDAPTGDKDELGANDTAPAHGVVVAATAAEDLVSATFGAALAGANNGVAVALAGSATANVLVLDTSATIDNAAVINPDAAAASAAQDVVVLAADRTRNLTAAGTLSASVAIPTNPEEPFAAAASAAAGADVLVVTKTTAATIAPSAVVNAGDSAVVRAVSAEESLLVSVAAGVAVGPSLAVAGSAGVGVFVTHTTATIGVDARVTAQGNVQVAADDETATALGVGNATVGGVGGGVSVGAFVITPTTLATVGDRAVVIGRGLRGAMTVDTGTFSVSATPYQSGTETFVPPSVKTTLPAGIDPAGTLPARLSQDQSESSDTVALRGVAVTATNQNESRRFVVGGGVGGVAVAPVASIEVIVATTHATVGDNAQINPGNASDGAAQSVLIAAGSGNSTLAVAGAFTAGVFAASPTADVAVFHLDTRATVGAGAAVRALGNVTVAAHAAEDFLTIAASGSGAFQGVAVAGTVAGVYIDDTTLAMVGSGATVRAGGDVTVAAADDTRADLFVGTAAFAGAGASIAATPVVKDIEASIGTGATVDALANAAGPGPHGVVVTAASTDTLFTLAAAGAVGGFGLAGSLSATMADVTTRAFVDTGAQINTAAGAAAGQSVTVTATDALKATTVAGTLSIGGGIGGSADVGLYRANTAAYLGDNTTVRARGDIIVHAHSDHDVTSVVATVAAGANSLGASVSVVAIDEALSHATAHDPNDAKHGTAADWLTAPGGQRIGGGVDDQTTGSGSILAMGLGKLGNYSNADEQQLGTGAADAQGRINAALTHGQIDGEIRRTDVPTGTTASIGQGADVRAGSSVAVTATQHTSLTQGAGVISVGLSIPTVPSLSVGASVTVAVLNSQTTATIGTGATVIADAAGTGGDLTVHAQLDEAQQAVAVVGVVNTGFLGLNAQVAVVDDTGTQTASTGDGVTVGGADHAELSAVGHRSLSARTVGGTLAYDAAGASVASATAEGATRAFTGQNVVVGPPGGPAVGSLSVTATATTPITAEAHAVAGGLSGAAQGSAAIARALPVVAASIGTNSSVTTTGATSVRTSWSGDQDATALGIAVAGSVGIGVSYARSDANPSAVLAVITPGVVVRAGSVDVVAAAAGTAHATSTAAGGGVLLGGTGAIASTVASPVVRARIDSRSQVRAGDVSVAASADAHAESDAFGISVGLVGVGVVLSTALASPQVTANLNADANATTTVAATGRLSVTATQTGSARAEATAPGVGLASGAGAQPSATASPVVQALIAAGVQAAGGTTVGVVATSASDAQADATTLNLGGAVAVGVALPQATASGSVTASVAGAIVPVDGIAPGDVRLAAAATNTARAAGDATSGSLGAAGLGVSSVAVADPAVTAQLAAGGSVRGAASLVVGTTTTTPAAATANGRVGGFLGVGVTFANADASPTVLATIAAGDAVQTTGPVTVGVVHNIGDVRGGATARTTAAAYGGIAGQLSKSQANASGTFTAAIGDGATVTAGDYVSVSDLANDSASATTDGTAGGLVAFGDVFSQANSSPNYRVTIGSAARVTAGGSVGVVANTGGGATADSTATAGGAVSVSGSVAFATASPNTQVSVGRGATVTAGTDVSLYETSADFASATAAGTSRGGISVGQSNATATDGPTVAVLVDQGATLTAGRDVSITIYHDQGATPARAQATGSNGSLIGTTGTEATANDTGTTSATVGTGAVVRAGRDVLVKATGGAGVAANAKADLAGFVAQGQTNAYGTVTHVNRAVFGGTATAGRNFDLDAVTTNTGDTVASGSRAGVIALSTVNTSLTVQFASTAQVAGTAVVTAGGTLNVLATSSTTAVGQAESDASALGVGAKGYATVTVATLLPGKPDIQDISRNGSYGDYADDTILGQYGDPTLATVDAGAKLTAAAINVTATVARANARALTYLTTGKAAGTANDRAVVGIIVPALVRVGTGAALTAPTVRLSAGYTAGTYATDTTHSTDASDQVLYNVETLGFSGNYLDNPSIGEANADVNTANFTRARVTADAGATITTSHLTVSASTPTVSVNARSQQTGGTNIGTGGTSDSRRALADDSVDFNARLIMTAAGGVLAINPDGTVARNTGLTVSQASGVTHVSGPIGGDTIAFYSLSPTVVANHYDTSKGGTYSTATFTGRPTVTAGGDAVVQVTDASAGTLQIDGLDLTTAGGVTITRSQGTNPNPASSHTVSDALPNPLAAGLTPSAGGARVSIEKTGVGNVVLAGPVRVGAVGSAGGHALAVTAQYGDVAVNAAATVYGGSTVINAPQGNVYGGGGVETATLNLFARGDIAASATGGNFVVNLDQVGGQTPSLQFSGRNVGLSLRGQSFDGRPLVLGLPATSSAGGNLTLVDRGGLSAAGTGVPFTYRLGGLSVGGDAVLRTAIAGANAPTWTFAGPASAGGTFTVTGGAIANAVTAGPAVTAAAAVLGGVTTIGSAAAPLSLAVGRLTTDSTGNQFLTNAGDVAVAGLRSTTGSVTLADAGAVSLAGPVTAAVAVTLTADVVAQTADAAEVRTGALTVVARTSDLGTAARPFLFAATSVAAHADAGGAGAYLAADGTTQVNNVTALNGSVFLARGTFVDGTSITAKTTNLLAGSLTGTGTVSGRFTVRGGTVHPGAVAGTTLRSGPVTFLPGSTFDVAVVQTRSGGPTTTALAAAGAVDLGGATLSATLSVTPGAAVRPGAAVTILTATSVRGRFAQGTSVVIGGQTFQIVYNATSVVLVLDRPPVPNAGGPYAIRQGDGLTLNGSRSSDPDGDPLTYSWTINGHAAATTGATPTLTAAQFRTLGVTTPGSYAAVLTVNDGTVSVNSAPVALAVSAVRPTVKASA